MTNTLERAPEPTGIARYLPFIDATKRYKKIYLRPDILAGLTAWAMVVPEGIGYASIAGMPAESALYAAALATLAYFLFGTSHEVKVGPSSALAIMSAATAGALGLSANSDAGVKTQYSTLFTSIAIVLTLLFLTWFFENLADAAIAAIVIHAVWSLIRPKMWPRLWKTARMEFWAALVTALVVMSVGEVEGLAIGILIAILIVTAKVSSARVRRLGFSKAHDAYVETDVDEQAALTDGVVIVRPDAEPMSANTSDFHDALMDAVCEAPTTPHCVVIDMVTAADIDVTAGEGLAQVHEELGTIEINLKSARVGAVTQSDMDNQGLTDLIGASNIHGTIREAVTDATSAKA